MARRLGWIHVNVVNLLNDLPGQRLPPSPSDQPFNLLQCARRYELSVLRSGLLGHDDFSSGPQTLLAQAHRTNGNQVSILAITEEIMTPQVSSADGLQQVKNETYPVG